MRNSLVRKAAEEQGQQIDLTPMLDVVFIMLIFFLLRKSMMLLYRLCVRKLYGWENEITSTQDLNIAWTIC